MTRQGYVVNGTRELVATAWDALEALRAYCGKNVMVAEFYVRENEPVEAVLTDEYGHSVHVWNGEAWQAKDEEATA